MISITRLKVAAVAVTLAFAGSAFAMTKAEIKAEKSAIASQLGAASTQCKTLKANAKDICMAEAKGASKVARAELEERQSSTPKTRYNTRVAKAQSIYDVAREKCDDLAGNVKDVCVKDAKAVLVTGKANAKSDMKAVDAREVANEKVSAARKDATEDKRDANYAAAAERCDKFSGEVKNRCVADAKASFGVK